MIKMTFSRKSLRFIQIAIEAIISDLKLKISDKTLDEDSLSDYTNDYYYYEAILSDIKKHLES